MILATVTEVSVSEVRVLIDGENTPTSKYYKCACQIPSVGDRVTIEEKNGSYVVTGILDNSLRWTLPVGTNTLTVTLAPSSIYLAAYSEFIDSSSVIASRMYMIATVPSGYPNVTTAATEFASTGSSKPISGLVNFQIRVTKVSNDRIGYLALIKM